MADQQVPRKQRKTVEEILATRDIGTDELYIPEWETDIKVTGLTKREQLEIRAASMVEGEPDAEKSQANMFLRGVLEPRFTEDQMGALFEHNPGIIDKILSRILELSGMKPEGTSMDTMKAGDAIKAKEAAFRKE
jgi:hypothetical protein